MILKPSPWSLEMCRLSPEAQELWRLCVLAFPLWDMGQRYAHDQSPYGNHGTFGAGLLTTDWVGSPYGAALSFGGGLTDVITVADPVTSWLDNGSAISAEVVFCPTSVALKHGLLNKYWTSAGQRSWRWYMNLTELELQVSVDGTAYEVQTTSGAGLTVGTWYHAIFTFRSGVFKTYLQGKSIPVDADFATTSVFGGPQPLLVGQRLSDGGGAVDLFLGQIASVRVWQRELSAWEAQALYEAPWAMYDPGILGMLPGPGYALEHSGGSGPGPWWDAGTVQKGVQALLIEGLDNGVKHDVQAFTRDTSNNVSAGSVLDDATPVGMAVAWGGVRRVTTSTPRPPAIRRALRR